MKYIRTKDGIYEYTSHSKAFDGVYTTTRDINHLILYKEIVKQANTIEELCDEFVVVQKDFRDLLNADTHCLQTLKRYYEINKIEVLGIYGAIWTDKGLIYVAKLNEKGELELL